MGVSLFLSDTNFRIMGASLTRFEPYAAPYNYKLAATRKSNSLIAVAVTARAILLTYSRGTCRILGSIEQAVIAELRAGPYNFGLIRA